jgi:hypothetical protein
LPIATAVAAGIYTQLGMTARLDQLRAATVAAVLDGPGRSDAALRRAAARGDAPDDLRELVTKIRDGAYRVTDADLDRLRPRYSEDQLFEIIIAATVGAADERLAAALRALEEA